MKNKILVLSFSLLAFSSSEVLAVGYEGDGLVDAYADLSWSSLAVAGVSAYTYSHSQSMARTADYWDITTQPTWVQQTRYNTTVSIAESIVSGGDYEAAKATGETGAAFISSQSTVQLLSSSYGASYSAEARAMQGQTYYVASAGTVTFNIPYELDVEVIDNNGDNAEYTYTRAWSWLRLWAGGNVWNQIAGTYSEATSGAGSLNISYVAAAGSYLLFEAGADTRVALSNPAPVPVPPSVLMLLTGCTSLFFLKRRKS